MSYPRRAVNFLRRKLDSSHPQNVDPFGLSFADTTGRVRAELPKDGRIATILVLGQSNAANEGEAAGVYAPRNIIHQISIFDGQCYLARDPLLGATGAGGSFLCRMADKLIDSRTVDHVVLIPAACGGTCSGDWVPGGRMHARMKRAASVAKSAITHVILQNGEADVLGPPEIYEKNTRAMILSLRRLGVSAPVFIARCTYAHGRIVEGIRQVQTALADGKTIFSGPDTDQITSRYDGVHLSKDGLQKVAAMWSQVLMM